ncbi:MULTISPECIES: hypothetical protein [Variovorax]|uniref:hypothetical protein n=1 Tax=Variovorax TaxID=34072 RepID=UPI0028596057|nr:hypothetical protein [Variovorax sp. 3319]MDR6886137.1 hypothetical protein [Variovorax sp. 3319]
MANIEQFLEKHADADGNVSEEAMARLLTGDIEGDTTAAPAADTGAPAAGTEATTDAPAAAPAAPAPAPAAPAPAPAADATAAAPAPTPAPAPAAAPAAEGADSVILAKDGKHTIPYQKLASAREEAKAEKARADQAEAEAAQLREQLAKATTAPAAAPASAPADAPAPAGKVFGDYSDEAIEKGLSTLVAKAMAPFKEDLAAQLEPVKRQAAETAAEAHFRTIYTHHPDMDSIVDSAEYQQWLTAQPSLVRQTYEAVLAKGTAGQVVEMLDTYKAAQPATAPAPAPAPAAAPAPAVDPQKKADEVIASVKPKTPTSLTDVPAGSQAHHDEAEAMAEMSPLDLMAKFEGKTPAQIEALMRKLV